MASDWADEQGRTQLKFGQCRLPVNLKIVAGLPPSLICLFANKLAEIANGHRVSDYRKQQLIVGRSLRSSCEICLH